MVAAAVSSSNHVETRRRRPGAPSRPSTSTGKPGRGRRPPAPPCSFIIAAARARSGCRSRSGPLRANVPSCNQDGGDRPAALPPAWPRPPRPWPGAGDSPSAPGPSACSRDGLEQLLQSFAGGAPTPESSWCRRPTPRGPGACSLSCCLIPVGLGLGLVDLVDGDDDHHLRRLGRG